MSVKAKRTFKAQPTFTARLYDLRPGLRAWEHSGIPVMEVSVYFPPGSVYDTVKPYLVTYTDEHGRDEAIRFSGVRIDPNRREMRRLCFRLAFVREGLVGFIRSLAAKAGSHERRP